MRDRETIEREGTVSRFWSRSGHLVVESEQGQGNWARRTAIAEGRG
jgi:hypothetical protein